MSVSLEVRKTVRAIAGILVAVGTVCLLLGFDSYRSDVKAFDCAHAKLDSQSLDKLFGVGDVPDTDKWDEWANHHDASIAWSVSSGTIAPGGPVLEPGRTWAAEVGVRGCTGSLSRERYALRPTILQDTEAMFGAGAIACGLVGLGVLRLTRKPSIVT